MTPMFRRVFPVVAFPLALVAAPALAAPAFTDLGQVLSPPDNGAWSTGVAAPTVDLDPTSGQLVMFFESPVAEPPEGCTSGYAIGRASSVDGITWVLGEAATIAPESPDGWFGCSATQPAVVYDGAGWHLFYTTPGSTQTGIAWAESPDGRTFTPHEVVLAPPGDLGLGLASATVRDGTLYLLYVDYPDIWLATHELADPPQVWSYTKTAVLAAGEPGSWASTWVLGPSVVCADDTMSLLYGGDDSAGARSLGLATSADGVSWAQDAGNPLADGTLPYGALNHWDILPMGEEWALWYSADHVDGGFAIGLATTTGGVGEVGPRACVADSPDTGDTGDTGAGETGDTDSGDTDSGDTDTGNPDSGDTDTDGLDTAEESGDSPGETGDVKLAGGCACASGSVAPAWPALLLGAILLRRRQPGTA